MSNMVINTNVLALNSHRGIKKVGVQQAKASARLSSGLRINSAADDAAGLAISEKMRAQIRGLDMASKNSQDAISLIQTAEGGMQEIDNMLQRIRELTVQAANDTNEHNAEGTGDRQKIQDEIDQLVKEIDSMSERVEFNKKKVINGDFEEKPETAVTEAYSNAKADLETKTDSYKSAIKDRDNKKTAVANAKSVVEGLIQNDSAGSIKDLISKIAPAGSAYDTIRTKLTTDFNSVVAAINAAKSQTEIDTLMTTGIGKDLIDYITDDTKLKAAIDTAAGGTMSTDQTTALTALKAQAAAGGAFFDQSKKVGTVLQDLATAESLIPTSLDALNTSRAAFATAKLDYDNAEKSGGLYFQIGANAEQGITLSIASIKSDKLGIGDGNGNTQGHYSVLETTGKDITGLLDKLDNALSYVTTERSRMGAAQNRLEYTISSLDVSSENMSAAESRIRDADMAKEMMAKSKADVLQQAATAMLAQANQAPQNVLQLLR